MAAADEDPLDGSIADHDERVADGVDVPERIVDPGNAVDVDGEGGDADVLVEVVEVLHRGDPVRRDRFLACALERGQLIQATRRTRNCFHADERGGFSFDRRGYTP